MRTVGLDSGQINTLGIGLIVGIVVIGLLLGLLISAIVGRIIVLVVVAALGVLVWQQRATIQDHVKKCELNMTFLGVHVKAPQDVTSQCRARTS
jgi:small basic protein